MNFMAEREEDFHEMATNLFYPEYPSLEEAIERIKSGITSSAISPNIALDKKCTVFYRTVEVGKIKNGKIHLLKGKEHYREAFARDKLQTNEEVVHG